MTVERFHLGDDAIESFMTGFFAAALLVSAVLLGYEVGAAAAGSTPDYLTIGLMATGAVAASVGLRRVGGSCCLGLCRLR